MLRSLLGLLAVVVLLCAVVVFAKWERGERQRECEEQILLMAITHDVIVPRAWTEILPKIDEPKVVVNRQLVASGNDHIYTFPEGTVVKLKSHTIFVDNDVLVGGKMLLIEVEGLRLKTQATDFLENIGYDYNYRKNALLERYRDRISICQ